MKQEEITLDHSFCTKFRKDIKAYGLKQTLRDLLSSTNKVAQKKLYLAREAEKKSSFKAELVAACDSLISENRSLLPAVRAVQKEILAA